MEALQVLNLVQLRYLCSLHSLSPKGKKDKLISTLIASKLTLEEMPIELRTMIIQKMPRNLEWEKEMIEKRKTMTPEECKLHVQEYAEARGDGQPTGIIEDKDILNTKVCVDKAKFAKSLEKYGFKIKDNYPQENLIGEKNQRLSFENIERVQKPSLEIQSRRIFVGITSPNLPSRRELEQLIPLTLLEKIGAVRKDVLGKLDISQNVGKKRSVLSNEQAEYIKDLLVLLQDPENFWQFIEQIIVKRDSDWMTILSEISSQFEGLELLIQNAQKALPNYQIQHQKLEINQ